MTSIDENSTLPTNVPAPKKVETFRSLNVAIKLRDGVDLTEALSAVEGLGEVQSIQIYQQRDYGPELY